MWLHHRSSPPRSTSNTLTQSRAGVRHLTASRHRLGTCPRRQRATANTVTRQGAQQGHFPSSELRRCCAQRTGVRDPSWRCSSGRRSCARSWLRCPHGRPPRSAAAAALPMDIMSGGKGKGQRGDIRVRLERHLGGWSSSRSFAMNSRCTLSAVPCQSETLVEDCHDKLRTAGRGRN